MRTRDCRKAARVLLLKLSGEASPEDEGFHEAHVSICEGCARDMKALDSIPPLEENRISREALSMIKSSSRMALRAQQSPARARRFLLKPALAAFAALAFVVFLLTGLPRETDDYFSYSAEIEYDLIDESIISAENSIHALKIEFVSYEGVF